MKPFIPSQLHAGAKQVRATFVSRTLAMAIAVFLGGCGLAHKPELQQGNVVTKEMLSKVRTGMSRREVQSLLGTPLVADIYHQDRWDYYYRLIPDNKQKDDEVIQNRVTVYFKKDRLVRVEDRITHDVSQ